MQRKSPNAKADRTERLAALFKERGVPLTHQRSVIFDSLVDRKDHPTADQVYEKVRKELPNISRMTVYRVLELFVNLGIITKVCHPGVAVRFDPTTDIHHHLICIQCHTLFDVEHSENFAVEPPDTRGLGFEVMSYSVQFRGLCADCKGEAS
jgi:Fur family peroxide stress response transcriptional regulator